MNPDRTNYEIWLIDYLDGTLNKDQVRMLMSFLEENPDIREELEEFSLPVLKDYHSFTNKNLLKKSVGDLPESQFELLCVAEAEEDLSEQQRAELEVIIEANPDKRKTLELIRRLKLISPDIEYNKKANLRKRTGSQKIIRLSVIGLSAAAGLAIMISLINTFVTAKDKSVPLVSINSSTLSDKIPVPENQVSDIIKKEEKKEPIMPERISVQNTLIKNIPPEKIFLSDNTIASDSASIEKEIDRIYISKTDFKQDVKLIENEFTGALVAMKLTEISAAEISEKPGFNDFIARVFRERILKSKSPETGPLRVYEVADAGIVGLNKLLGWQMSLQKTRDDKGELKSLYFSSKILKFNAPVRKVQLAP
jgi:hypothetical protein